MNQAIKSAVVSSGTHHGIKWEARQGPLGAINGYAQIPAGHVLRGRDLQMSDSPELRVHGGITFGPTDDGWIGFDTLHAGDIWPGMPESMSRSIGGYELRWTPEMVVDQARKLCQQIAEAVAGDES